MKSDVEIKEETNAPENVLDECNVLDNGHINSHILNTYEHNNLSFWKNMEDDLLGNKLFQEEKLENSYTYIDTDKQDKLNFDKNPNKRFYSDLKTSNGNVNINLNLI
jgi:hypothetical protein